MSSFGIDNGNNGRCCNTRLARHICEFIGETVTIFTSSGGVSGCGFTGVVLTVNSCFVRLITDLGSAPSVPISESVCGDFDSKGRGGFDGPGFNGKKNENNHRFGSVCDIPIENIVAFCHNAV